MIHGPGFFSSDITDDLRAIYSGMLQSGKTDEEALEATLKHYENKIENEDDEHDLYLGLAYTMWKKGRLTNEIKEMALQAIEKDMVAQRWDGNSDYRIRKKKLLELKTMLESPQPERKKVSVHKPYKIGFQENDVYYYQLPPIELWESDFDRTKYAVYSSKYLIFYVKSIYGKDWNVKGVPDDVAIVYFFISDNKPEGLEDIEKATFVDCAYEWVETSPKKRPSGITYLGNWDLSIESPKGYNFTEAHPRIFFGTEKEFEEIIWDYTMLDKMRQEDEMVLAIAQSLGITSLKKE